MLLSSFIFADNLISTFNILNVAPPTPFDWDPLTTHNVTQAFTWNESVDINGQDINSFLCIADTSINRDNEVCNVVDNYTNAPSYTFSGSEENFVYNADGNVQTYYVKITPFDDTINGTANSSIEFNLTDYAPIITTINSSSWIDTDSVLDIVKNIGENVTFNMSDWTDDDSDDVSLRVCFADSIGSDGNCTGETICLADFSSDAQIKCEHNLSNSDQPTNSNTAYVFNCDCPTGYQQCPARCGNSTEVTYYANHAPTMDAPEITWTN